MNGVVHFSSTQFGPEIARGPVLQHTARDASKRMIEKNVDVGDILLYLRGSGG